jgi:glutamate racemase
LLADAIRAGIGPSPTLTDSAAATAKTVARVLRAAQTLRVSDGRGELRLLATDGPARFARLGARFLGEPLAAGDVELVDL